MKIKQHRLAIIFLLSIFTSMVSYAAEINHTVKFESGKSDITLKGDVVRGDQDVYYLEASADQQMKVSISALEDNAAFIIYLPDSNDTLKGAGEEDDATKWSGQLPQDGKYKIVVGGTRGNASYSLYVSITD